MKNNKKGFTLAELLIVVAIIGVLVAISIPIFTAQLNKAKYATDQANARSLYAELMADYLANGAGTTTDLEIHGDDEANGDGTAYEIYTTNVAGDKEYNSYKFTGIVKVNVQKGDENTAPSVSLEACQATGDSPMSFRNTDSTTIPGAGGIPDEGGPINP